MAGLIELEKVCETLFGMTSRNYRLLANQGIVPPVRKGKIDFLKAVKSLIDHFRNLANGSGEPSLIRAREENILLKNDRLRFDNLITKGELMPRSEILAAFLWRIQVVKQGLWSLHRSLPIELTGKDPREIADILKRKERELLERFSRMSGVLKEVIGNGNGRNKDESSNKKSEKGLASFGTSEEAFGREREIGHPVEETVGGLGG